MSYYLGFRWGWVRFWGVTVGWHDQGYYRHWPRGIRLGRWKVWMQ